MYKMVNCDLVISPGVAHLQGAGREVRHEHKRWRQGSSRKSARQDGRGHLHFKGKVDQP